jgi:predicted ArsR family transcriptional regulator
MTDDLRLPEQIDPKAKTEVWLELKRATGPLSIHELYDRLDTPPRTIRNAVEDLNNEDLVECWYRANEPRHRMLELRD